jgi:hypothetical protein
MTTPDCGCGLDVLARSLSLVVEILELKVSFRKGSEE